MATYQVRVQGKETVVRAGSIEDAAARVARQLGGREAIRVAGHGGRSGIFQAMADEPLDRFRIADHRPGRRGIAARA